MCLVRDTMIKVLGDPRGVSLSARLHISKLLVSCGHEDIISKMRIVGDRWVLQGYAQMPVMPLTENNTITVSARSIDKGAPFKVNIGPEDYGIGIGIPGCGRQELEVGNEQVVFMDQFDDKTTIYVWDDINDPDHIEINMDEAYETNRRGE